MKVFPPSPELDWLRELYFTVHDDQDAEALDNVYHFLLWFGRMRKAREGSDEYLIAYGYTLRYREAVYREQLTPAEHKSAQMAEIGYAELKKERKKRASSSRG